MIVNSLYIHAFARLSATTEAVAAPQSEELSDFGSLQRCIVTQNDALAISAANLKAFDVFESGVDRSESG